VAGALRLLVRFDEPLRPTRRPEFAADAKRLYFTLAQSESDVWVIGLRQAPSGGVTVAVERRAGVTHP